MQENATHPAVLVGFAFALCIAGLAICRALWIVYGDDWRNWWKNKFGR